MATEAQKRAAQKYQKKCKQFILKYYPHEAMDLDALERYLIDTEQTANSYAKNLIIRDLSKKGYITSHDELEEDEQ